MNFAKDFVIEFWMTLSEMSPYLLFGFFVAALLSVLISQNFIEQHLGGEGIWPLVKASVLGVPLPLCSCGVIPVSMSLHKHGASKGSTISFLLSTPQTGVDSIFVTYSLLGPVFAIFRPLVAFFTGIIGGGLINLFDPEKERQAKEICGEACCTGKTHKRLAHGFRFAFITLPGDIGKAMLLGLVIAAFMATIIPDNYFADKLGHPILAMIVMMFLGIPVYVCATASVPIAAVLIMKGLTPGAALVFLMTGPATNAASFTTIYKALGRKTAILYLISVALCALAAGLSLDFIAKWFNIEVIVKPAHMLPMWLKSTAAALLLALLGYAIFGNRKKCRNSEQQSY